MADLPATAAIIVDPAERRRVLAVFVDEFNRRRAPESPWPEAVLEEWVERSPLGQGHIRGDRLTGALPDPKA
ncbi:MAG: hypothetical protein ABSC16_07190 [Candidatus Dormibacteria bacterium]